MKTLINTNDILSVAVEFEHNIENYPTRVLEDVFQELVSELEKRNNQSFNL